MPVYWRFGGAVGESGIVSSNGGFVRFTDWFRNRNFGDRSTRTRYAQAQYRGRVWIFAVFER
jgi:hypothetical protein